MTTPIELTITIKGETPDGDDSTYKSKHLIHDTITMTPNDPIIKKCLQEALSGAKIKPDDIKIRTVMQVK